MAEEKQSAEKDLLKLIENPGSADAKKAQSSKEPDKKSAKSKASNTAKKPLDLKAVFSNRKTVVQGLVVVMVAVFGALLFNIYSESAKLKLAKNFDTFFAKQDKKIVPMDPASPEASASPVAEASEGPETPLRNIFRPKPKKTEEVKPVDNAMTTLQNYKLVGISLDEDPKNSSAMIESLKTNITFFLRKGEKLDGMELLDIFEDKLILKIQGQTVEMR